MATALEAGAIAVLTFVGAGGVAAVTLLEYQPPPREDGSEPPEPVFEAALFFVLGTVGFSVVGSLLAFVAKQAPPYGRLATVALTPICLYSAYASYEGRPGWRRSRASELMAAVTAAVLGLYPVALFVVSGG